MKRRHVQRRGGGAQKGVEHLEARYLLSAGGTVVSLPGVSVPPGQTGGVSAVSASSLVQGADGNIWFTDQGGNAIGRETPGGSTSEFALPTADAGPDHIVAGADGNLWFVETYVDMIGRITPAGDVTEFNLPANASADGIAAGPGGGVWFVDSSNNQVGRVTAAGKVTEFSFGKTNLSLEGGITASPDGSVWAAATDDAGNGALARVTPTGKISSIALTAFPNDLAVGPDGNIWVASDGEIDRVKSSGSVTPFMLPNADGAFDITSGPDGALWFGLYGTNAMGRMTTGGEVMEINPPGLMQYGFVNDLASGPLVKIWYASDSTASGSPIVSFDPHNALLAAGTQSTATAGASSTMTVASFVDGVGNADPAFYSASIDWGDGTKSAGTITVNDRGGFDVIGNHAWGIGSSDIAVTISDIRSAAADPGGLAGRSAIAYSNVTSPAPAAQGVGVDVGPVSGQLFSGVVAHYTGVLLISLSSYSANIDWGDGHFTSGVIAADGLGGVSISGDHRYAAAGEYTISTNLWPWSFGPVVPIAGGGGGVGRGVGIVARGGAASVAPPTVSVAGAGGGTVVSPPIGIVPDPLGGSEGTSSSATVIPGAMDGTGYSLIVSSKETFSNTVAIFTPTDPNADLTHFHATVKWNDGDTFDWFQQSMADVTDAPIASDGNGGFSVSATVKFPQFGWFHYQVLISDDRLGTGDGSIVGVAYGQVVVDTPIRPLPVGVGIVANAGGGLAASAGVARTPNSALSEHVTISAVKIKPAAGKAFSGDVGVLTGVAKGTAASALSGTIHWGDGASTAAQFVAGKKGKFHVRGVHTYLGAGNETITISMIQKLNGAATPGSEAPIQLPHGESMARVGHGHHRVRMGKRA